MTHGGSTRRPGTYFVSAVKDSSKKVRLYPFEFSTTQAYIIEFGDQHIRFYKEQGQIVVAYAAWVTGTAYALGALVTNGGVWYRCIIAHTAAALFATDLASGDWVVSGGATDLAYEIPSPYLEADLFDLKFEQSADILYIAHKAYAPRKLTRTGHTAWTLSTQTFWGSAEKTIASVTVVTTKIILNVTVANPGQVLSEAHTFNDGDSVVLNAIEGMIELNGTTQTVAGATVDTFNIEDTTLMTPYTANGTATRTVTTIGITQANPGMVQCVGHGFANGDIVKITGVVGMTQLNDTYQTVAGVTDDTFTICNTSAMTAYTSGGIARKMEFYGTGNYPGCVAFFEERLGYAGTTNEPQTLWLSVSGDYENMSLGDLADDALKYTINSDMVNAILWMVSQDYLMLGTNGGIWKISGSGTDPITPTSVSAKRQSTRGGDSIAGMLVNDIILYVQRAKRKVREVSYDYRKDGYNTPDLTILAEHITLGDPITSSGITCWDYQQEPDSIIWCIRADGVLIGLTYEKDQEVVGWHPHYTEGKFESVAVIPGDDEDEIWVSVCRTINSVTKRYVEYFKPREFGAIKEDAFFVDCGLTFDGGAAVTFTGVTAANPVVVTAVAHPFITGDRVIFSGVGGMEELNDQTYLVVKDSTDAFHLHDDDGVNIDGSAFTAWTTGGTVQKVSMTFSGLSHLATETVSVCADGGAEADEVVSAAGVVTLGGYFNKVHIGLPSEWLLQPMKLEAGSSLGTSQGQLKKVDMLTLRLYQTGACKIGPDVDHQKDLIFDFQEEDLFSGDHAVEFVGGVTKGGDLVLTSNQPLPVTVLAIIAEVTTYERNSNV